MANNLDQYNEYGNSWWQKDGPFYVLNSMNQPRFEFFDRYISEWKDLKVLDVGCGGGFTCEFMAKRGAQVSGVDISEVSVATAQSHAKESGLEIDYRISKGEKLPHEDNTFDVVTCVDVLEHVEDVDQVVREIHRVLKPGGTFLFDTINKTFKSKFIMIWLLEYIKKEIPKGTHDWNMFIPPKQMENSLVSGNFQDIELAGFDVKGIDGKTKSIIAEVNDNLSVMYLGKAVAN